MLRSVIVVLPLAGEQTYQHISIIHIEVEKEQEGDEEAEEGEHGSFPETPHLVHGLPH